MTAITSLGAAAAYDALAAHYDTFTAGYRHAEWLRRIHELAVSHGLAGHRVLDVGCGTGKSLEPLLDLGYTGTGVDISPEMVRLAAERLGDRCELHVGDVRDLDLGERFDLITMLDDAVNYLATPADLRAGLAALARHLAPRGLLVFDVNALSVYCGSFSDTHILERGDRLFCWRASAADPLEPGAVVTATLDVFQRSGEAWERTTTRHIQRHHPLPEIHAALTDCGLRAVGVHGQRPGGVLDPVADESIHPKVLLMCAGRGERR